LAATIGGVGCRAPGERLTDDRPEGRPMGPTFFPKHAAPGRILALAPITGVPAETEPPGPVLRAVTGLTTQPSQVSQLVRPLSVAVRAGRMLICDIGRRSLVEMDPRTGELRLVQVQGLVGPFDPVAVATDEQGNAYVADSAGKRVVRISESNAVLRTYEMQADAPLVPMDLAISADRLYVANRASRQIEVFDLASGEHLGPFGNPEQASVGFPVAVAVDGQGRVYVVDMGTSRVRVYDGAGELLREFGGPGNRPGLFAKPRSVAVGPDGITYITDTATEIVQMFDAAGALLMHFGGTDAADGRLDMPAKIIANRTLLDVFASRMPAGFAPQYMLFVAEQAGPGRIGVYAFGRMEAAATQEAPQQ
jgi:DNA-binding beta-propeller fold protein YncE